MSTTAIIGEFRIGEDITLAIDATTGDVGDVSAITAQIRPMTRTGNRFVFGADLGNAMTVTPRAAAGAIPAGWNLTYPAASSALLAAGFYGIDARLTISGGVDITDQSAVIDLSEAAL